MKYYVAILLALSALTHFAFFGRPAEVVFDEVYFGKFAAAYDSGKYFFDVHPPLGKLLISETGRIAGYNATAENFGTIGNNYTDSRYVWFRLLPMIAGFLLPLVIFLLARELGMSDLAAFFAGTTVILENSLLVQSRFMFLDSFLLLFGFLALYFYMRARRAITSKLMWTFLCLSAVFAACSFSVKWTGFAFLGLIALYELWSFIHRESKARVKRLGSRALTYICVGFVLYFSIFAIHFALLTKSGGPGSDDFMTPAFQKTLAGSKYVNDQTIQPEGEIAKFFELNREMYDANKTLTATHSYSSKWYTWPIMSRDIYYWVRTESATSSPLVESKIYLLGNPLIYWLSGLAVLGLFGFAIYRLGAKKFKGPEAFAASALAIGYFANWLPFIFIGRVMFLYHYEAALIFAAMALAFMIDRLPPTPKKHVAISLLVVFALSFVFFSPLTYGLPLSTPAQNLRFWFNSWI